MGAKMNCDRAGCGHAEESHPDDGACNECNCPEYVEPNESPAEDAAEGETAD
jgi:hypothetical protein